MTDLLTLALDEVYNATSFLVQPDNVGSSPLLLGCCVGGTTNRCLISYCNHLQATSSTLDLDISFPEQDDLHVYWRSDCCSSQTSNDDGGHEDDINEITQFVIFYDHYMNKELIVHLIIQHATRVSARGSFQFF